MLNMLSYHNRNPLFFTHNLWSQDVVICLFPWFMIFISRTFIADPFVWHLTHVNIKLYVLRRYYHTHKDKGVLGFTTHDYWCEIPSSIFQKRSLETFPAQSFLLCIYTHYFEWKIINHQCAPIIFYDNLITFILTWNSNY